MASWRIKHGCMWTVLGSRKRVAGMGGWEWCEVVAWTISVGKRNWMDRVRK